MDVASNFLKYFNASPAVVGRAPGRLEILGNHTDYNHGYVLSAAVEQRTEFALRPVAGRKCSVRLFKEGTLAEFDLDDLDRPVPGDWSNYVKGVVARLRKRGIEVGAFEAGLQSTVPMSAGMSSSAALEISAAFAMGAAFGIDLPKAEWARIGQECENEYVGVNTGLLDQFSSIFGRKNSLILCDFRKVEVLKNVTLPSGYVIVVANSMVKHNLVDSDYNRRRESCERAALAVGEKNPGVTHLRDVDMAMLDASKSRMSHEDYLRARHVVGEDERVMSAVKLLESGDVESFGRLLYESHESSRRNFENSCPELDHLVELSRTIPGCVGARLSGGGFGGISIHLVSEHEAERYCVRLKTACSTRGMRNVETIICAIGDGASVEKIQ